VKHLLIATDAWRPQVNGVVRTLETTAAELRGLGLTVTMLTPEAFRTVPCPGYPEIRLALASPGTIGARIAAAAPDHVHIATEGPIGFAARRWCLRHGRRFTTSFHTRFPEYLSARAPIPESWTYAILRRFHNAGSGCMVSTATLEKELATRGFRRLMRWSRGVDAELFRPRPETKNDRLPRPVFLYVGRVAVEKNVDAFLGLNLPGSKVVVGDGPALAGLKARYPGTIFRGALHGEALAEAYAGADVFVFPSRTDTFGVVLLEALASGLPVAAFPVPGPADVVGAGVGVLSEDLGAAALAALDIPGSRCREYSLSMNWSASTGQFLDNVRLVYAPAPGVEVAPVAVATNR
jgi:glycosyltransferase involved in cell wall biosynthesis